MPNEIMEKQKFIGKKEFSISRSGVTQSGRKYTYFQDRSGSLESINPADGILEGKWSIACPIDAMSDRMKCNAKHYGANLYVFFGTDNVPDYACIIGHDFPGRVGAIRVEANPPLTTDTEGCIAGGKLQTLIGQLRTASKVTTRRVEWPYDYSRDEVSTSADGFGELVQLIGFLVNANMSSLMRESEATEVY